MSYALENFVVQREVEDRRFRVVVKVSDSFSPNSTTILDKSFPTFISIFIVPLVAIFVVVLIIIWMGRAAGISVLDTLKNLVSPSYQVNYEEAKKWFEEGNGYLASLSEEEKNKLRSKKDFPF